MGINIKLLGRCPDCDSPNIKDVIEDRPSFPGGKKIIIPNVPHEKCFDCGERSYDHNSMVYMEAFLAKKNLLPRVKKRKTG
ncbi:MAG: hypothetical protein A2Z91_04995 [Deltaproteobacteria bacterium GWA2_38_16]|nr:MAG: hypothetical protein A2Z91_04995 [Deltaproteobacteria bacterium GWA2_38_16]OGQ03137.1 MAG: hypothetical protein A3D19_03725 [Deltaproteobacteria bacterium RIFCSPHIGHO2_02_FULL_38_15]OGQ30020.1 MAG: hypothetical protein A3A72_09085 [Deltaproteobacteria bacterium RIFCSPLOWO2_01_FULL_38_9]HBQ20441.1 hypothetical protein [Deltaproteobacteria bacterium]